MTSLLDGINLFDVAVWLGDGVVLIAGGGLLALFVSWAIWRGRRG